MGIIVAEIAIAIILAFVNRPVIPLSDPDLQWMPEKVVLQS
jgi:hypothetical protein